MSSYATGVAAGQAPEAALAFGSDLDSALLEGLDEPSVSSGESATPDFSEAFAYIHPVPDAVEPDPGIDDDLASALMEGLADIPVLSPDDPEPPGPEPEVPADTIDADLASALMEGLADIPVLSPANPEPPGPEPEVPADTIDADLASALVEGLADIPVLSPDGPEPPGPEPEASADAIDDDLAGTLVEGLADIPVLSPDDPEPPGPEPEVPADTIDADLASALMDGLADGPIVSSAEPDLSHGPTPAPADSVPEPGTRPSGQETEFAGALVEGLADAASVSSEDPGSRDLAEIDLSAAAPGDAANTPAAPVDLDARPGGEPHGQLHNGPAAALAFAMDPETEDLLREGLLYYEAPSSGCDDPQVWPGGLAAAISALADGHSTRLVIVDIDGVPYPAGAIHELAEVCEVGTAVIAVGSDDSARLSREILLAGVSDYLVKPITAEAVRAVTARVAASERDGPGGGCVAGFTGTGGSGATILAAATALQAADRGRYVSVLDLNRKFPAAAVLLDVEPAPGLDQLFEVAGKMPADPRMLDGVRAERSERISVYSYRWNQSPPPVPSMPALDWLIGQLRHRSQLVLVDGLDDPATNISLLAKLDTRVLVAEPTAGGAVRAARMLDLLGPGSSTLLVQNHTRAFKAGAGAGLLLEAGVERPPDITVPFDRALSEIVDRGWPQGRAPRRLRKPLASLADRILVPGPGLPEPLRGSR